MRLPAHRHRLPPHSPLQVTGLWILLAGAVATAVCVFLLGQLVLCSARRVARTKAYRASLRRVKTAQLRTLSSLQRMSAMPSVKRRTMIATEAGGGSDDGLAPCSGSDEAADVKLRKPSPGSEEQQAMLAAAVDVARDLAARLDAVQRLVDSQRHSSSDEDSGNALV